MNSGTIKGLIGLVLGAIAGGIAAYKIQRERWEDKYYDEVEEIKEAYIRGEDLFEDEGKDVDEDTSKDKNDISPEDEAVCQAYIDTYRERYKSEETYSGITLTRYRDAKKKERELKAEKDARGIKTRPYVDHPYYISEEEYYQMCESVFDYRGYELYFDDETRDVYNVDGTLFAEQSDAWVCLGKGMMDVMVEEAPDPLYIQNDDLKEVYMLFKSRGSGMNEHRHTAGPPRDGVWHRYEFGENDEELDNL